MPEPSLDDIALLDRLDVSRRAAGLLTVRGILETVAHDNAVLDPFSLLVAAGVRIGRGNVFHPSVELITSDGGQIEIGDDNRFHLGSRLAAEAGRIVVGCGNQLGEGGLVIVADRPGEAITIGDHGRYRYGTVRCFAVEPSSAREARYWGR